MNCTSCGTQLLDGKLFCHECGAAALLRCPHCGIESRPEHRFCPDCGHSLRESAPAAPRPAPAPDPRFGGTPGASAWPRQAAAQPSVPIAGERKQVTVLFCDLEGSTAIAEGLDPEEYRDLLERYLELCIREVDRMEGIVNQLAGDGFMALFGAPIAHEDEPERATRAALAIQAALTRLNRDQAEQRHPELRARIGIHTGPVVVGTVGNDLKMDYTAIGDTTNLAARLQSLAEPGTILISGATRNLVAGRFELHETGPIDVRGKSEPVVAWEVRSFTEEVTPMAIAEARGLTPLVGLQEELSQLDACFERLTGGMPQLVSVIGDPGSGKSRLVYEFKRRLAGHDAVLLEARASALTQSVPFAPLTNMLKQFFGLAPGEETDCACQKIAERVKRWDTNLDEIYPAMCKLLATSQDDDGAESPRQQVMEAFERLLGGLLREAPGVVILLEDLHWMDEASRELIERQVAGMERLPVMALVTHRPEYQPHWQVRSASTQIVLRPLLDEQAAEIARARAGGPLPAELEKRIVGRAEGNPFFVEEITRALVEQGQIVKDDLGVHVTGPIDKIRIPGTVQELIEARLDRLSPRAKRLAQVAAVFGRQFRIDQLRQLLEPEGIDVGAGLEELLGRGLVHSASTERGEYRFGESLTQSVCYEGLLIRERRDLHERIAGMIEEDPRGISAERAGLIAHHLARSENRGKAIGSLLVAARAAEELPSYPSSAALFRQAWQLAEQGLRDRPDDPEALRTVLEATLGICRVTVLYVSGDGQTEERAAVRARELAEQLSDLDSLTHALTLQGMIVIAGDGTRFSEGLELMERGFQIAEEHGLERALISSRRALGWTYLRDGQFAKSSEVLRAVTKALESLGEREPPSDLYLSIQYFKSMASYWQDDLDQAKQVALWTHDACVEKGNRTLRTATAAVLAQTHFAIGRYPEALEWATEALSIGKEIGNVGAIRTGAVVSLASKLELGERVNPAKFLDVVVDQQLDVTGDSGVSGNLVVELLVELGELERASRYADAMALRSGGRLRQMQCLLAVAHALRARGDAHLDESEEEYQLALAVARELGAASFEIAAQIGLASIAVQRGEPGTGSHTLREAAALAESRGLARLRDQALRVLAETTALHRPEADTIPPRIN